ncbi:hypothetical protein IE53DRAFT_176707 [Violaceomyces palustris]|uniref:Uncharacterized protein n=1 Tax=Violaceomyces palustris TaxID=1673888 RepID=A0ACD0NSS8_9BASI|nr:hypothetical protein IE53DRAFT_176707 [Violaceomyces palustris]
MQRPHAHTNSFPFLFPPGSHHPSAHSLTVDGRRLGSTYHCQHKRSTILDHDNRLVSSRLSFFFPPPLSHKHWPNSLLLSFPSSPLSFFSPFARARPPPEPNWGWCGWISLRSPSRLLSPSPSLPLSLSPSSTRRAVVTPTHSETVAMATFCS